MKLGLFENPYVNPSEALAIANNPESQAIAEDAHRRSIVLLKNNERLLPLRYEVIPNVRLYVEMFPAGENNEAIDKLKQKIRSTDNSITIVDNLNDATHAFVWVKPFQDLFANNPTIEIGPDTGVNNVEWIFEIQKTVPTITAIHFSNPWLINTIELNAAAFIATFGTKPKLWWK